MDQHAQDVMLCDLCGTYPLLYFCDQCDINLCTNCVTKHISDSSKEHKVLPYKLHKRFTPQYPKCLTHADKDCELYCEKCEIPTCSTCLSLGKHKGHDLSDVLKKLDSEKQRLRKDLEDLENKIYPRYEEMASHDQSEKVALETKYAELTTAADQRGEVLYREVTAIVNQRKATIAETKNEHFAALQKHTHEITQKMNEIKHVILEMKNILDTNDIYLTSTFRSRNDEFNKLPPIIKVTMPILSTPKLNTEKLNEMIGTFSSLPITTTRSMLAEPRFTASIDTGYEELYSVSCLSDEQVWTQGKDKIMKLFNLHGELLTSIQTESGQWARDIAVTRDGDLVYTDTDNRTVNLVKNKQIRTVITLQGWRPRNVCCTASSDLLVTMYSDDKKQSKVVRCSGSRETQTIQFDDEARPLYSSAGYISENRNLDICVADWTASAVVVVNQSGKLRFRYTGHPSNTKESFNPAGITTDSQSHILTADYWNHSIHILDQNGQFLRRIHNLYGPYGLCVDIRDNLFVVEFGTAKVNKIQYI